MFDLRLADGLSQNPSASTAALKSGASRARYAAMGLDRGEASETIGNDAVDAHLCPHCGHRRYVTLLLCSGHFNSVATCGVVSVTPRSHL